MASELVQNFKNQFKIHPGFVIVFVAIVIIGLIFYKQIAQLFSARKDSATDPESTDLVLKREDKVDINFTKAVKSIKDKDQTLENVDNAKQACTYIKDHKGKIPEEFKTITEQIMELTSNCTPVDCEGTWSDFVNAKLICAQKYTRLIQFPKKVIFWVRLALIKLGTKKERFAVPINVPTCMFHMANQWTIHQCLVNKCL